jgi:hypothetical protein
VIPSSDVLCPSSRETPPITREKQKFGEEQRRESYSSLAFDQVGKHQSDKAGFVALFSVHYQVHKDMGVGGTKYCLPDPYKSSLNPASLDTHHHSS